jgi:hypothetical protein
MPQICGLAGADLEPFEPFRPGEQEPEQGEGGRRRGHDVKTCGEWLGT